MVVPNVANPKILYIAGQLDQGGAEQQFFYLLKYLKPQATVLSLSSNGYWADPIRKLGYDVIELNRTRRADFFRLWATQKLIKNLQPDVIHILLDGVSGLYGRIAAIIHRHPCVIVGERINPSFHPTWYSFMKRKWLNRHVSAIIANASSSRSYLTVHENLPIQKAKFIPNGLELDRFGTHENHDRRSCLPESSRNKVIIGTIGNLFPRKGPETYVRAARKVLNHCDDARFLHIGNGPLEPVVKDLSRNLGIEECVHYLGHRHDIPELLCAMDIFMLTSLHEGMPNAVMEAMATGLPCVVTDTGDCKELVRDGETGFVVPIGDEEQLADRILRLIRHRELRQEMGRKGREAIQRFDVHRMVEQYQDLYQQVLRSAYPEIPHEGLCVQPHG